VGDAHTLNVIKKFGYHINTMSKLIGEEVRKRRMSRDAQIYRISMLGWTQEEIGELFGITKFRVSQIVKNFTDQALIREQFYERGKPVEEIAEF